MYSSISFACFRIKLESSKNNKLRCRTQALYFIHCHGYHTGVQRLGFTGKADYSTAGVSSLVSASACRNLVPDKGSTRLKVSLLPPRPRIPVAKSWSRQSVCLALKSSSASPMSSKGFTTGAGRASTVKGPVIRTLVLSISGDHIVFR